MAAAGSAPATMSPRRSTIQDRPAKRVMDIRITCPREVVRKLHGRHFEHPPARRHRSEPLVPTSRRLSRLRDSLHAPCGILTLPRSVTSARSTASRRRPSRGDRGWPPSGRSSASDGRPAGGTARRAAAVAAVSATVRADRSRGGPGRRCARARSVPRARWCRPPAARPRPGGARSASGRRCRAAADPAARSTCGDLG